MYAEFLNCNSYLYDMQDKNNSESISSDGEFDEFKYHELVDQKDQLFIDEEYKKMLKEKYSHDTKALNSFYNGRLID